MSNPSTTTVERRRGRDTGVSRRRLLGAAAVAFGTALSGCTATGARRDDEDTLIDETLRVDPGRYEAVPFALEDDRRLTVEATLSDRSVDVKRDGPAVDVVVMTATAYREFESRRAFSYVGGVSMPDVVSGQVSGTVDHGEYVALVDNTDTGPAAPGSSGVTAVVDLTVTATGH